MKQVIINPTKVIEAYKECALWASKIDELTIYDILPSLSQKMDSDVISFLNDMQTWLRMSGLNESEIGHSLWLTQNHHGAGFFDYSIDQNIIDTLTDRAHKIGEYNLFINEQNHICI